MLRATRELMGNRFQDRTRCSKRSRTIVTVLGQRYRSKAMFHGKVIRGPTYMGGSKALKGPRISIGIMRFRKSKGNHQVLPRQSLVRKRDTDLRYTVTYQW